MNRKISGELPRPPKKTLLKLIFFFDVDGTLIEENGKTLISDPLKSIIQRFKKRNVLFGMNTGRSWAQSKEIYKSLKFNGPIIVENGSAHLLNKKGSIYDVGKHFLNIRKEVCEILYKYFNQKYGIQASLFIRDDKKKFGDATIQLLLLASKSRHFSISLYVKNFGHINQHFTGEALDILKNKFKGKYDDLKLQQIKKEGKILIFYKNISKVKTMFLVGRQHFNGYKLILVSDKEKSLDTHKKIFFASVKNGDSAYKKQCHYIAKRGGARGISEIINKFAYMLN